MFSAVTAAALVGLVAGSHVHMEAGKAGMRDDYTRIGRADAEATHEVVFAVKQNNLDALKEKFYEVSNPKSASYGKYLSRKEVAELTANPDATARIVSFLNARGAKVTKRTRHGEYITVEAPVSMWEDIFNTQFMTFKHTPGFAASNSTTAHRELFRALDYSLPAELADHVHSVFNTVQLPGRAGPGVKYMDASADTAATGSMTPEKLNSYYNVPSNTGSPLASQCVFASLDQNYSPSDLAQFESDYNVESDQVDTVIGEHEDDAICLDDPNNCIEANLDVEYMIAMSTETPTTFWYQESDNDMFLNWVTAVVDSENPPLVSSISYGGIEDELSKSMLQSFDTEAQKLAVMGVSVLASSGDDGVANFQARNMARKCGYHPSFPASSPYVTAIGATQGPESGTEEIACTSQTGGVITTGGGFSSYYAAPDYQSEAVSSYFAGLPASEQPAAGYEAGNRGYPDISSAGLNYEVVVGGKMYKVSGTSASSPVVAGMVSLVNSARLEAGKPALGFLNTAIYQNGAAISNDITSGENQCTAGRVCCDEGFYAASGWDPLTGFGSLDYTKFYNVFFNL